MANDVSTFAASAPCDSLPCSADSVDRRAFLRTAAAAGFCAAVAGCVPSLCTLALADDSFPYRKEAGFYNKQANRYVQCQLCPRGCVVADGNRGFCRVRENQGGTYYSLVHSRVVAAHVDPIEKKPFFHFLPGELAFSIATGGCNVNCKFCQNWEISQARPEQLQAIHYPPKELADAARARQTRILAYTYSEPIVFWEYVMDAAEAGHRLAIRSVVISNGFIQQEPLRQLCARVDAIKIDLKGITENYYRDVVRGQLKPVLDTLATVRKNAKWMEIVYLTVRTLNDSDTDFRSTAQWVKTNLGADVPIHFTRFQPLYLLKNLPPTPVATLERAKAIADSEGLQYVYIGNVPGHAAENTYCPKCRKLLIERAGFTVVQMNLKKGKCPCGQAVPGVWT